MTELKIRNFPRSLPRALESVARLVPGYRGYAAKEDRREEDKRLRTQIARCLREASQDLHRAVRTLPAQPMSVPLARSWAEGWLVAHVPSDHCDEVLLVVSELVTNAVRQGDGTVRVTLQAEDRGVRVEVFDRGHRMPYLADAALRLSETAVWIKESVIPNH